VLYQITQGTFAIVALTAPNMTKPQVGELLSPFLTGLDQQKVSYQYAPSYFDNYYDHFAANFGPLPFGPFPASELTSSRLIPRDTLKDQPAAVSKALRNTVKDGKFYTGCLALNANLKTNTHSDNAVLPAWRDALTHCILVGPWDWTVPWTEMLAREDELTNDLMPALEAVTPGSGTYLNEANFQQPDWQQQFYGANYNRLLDIKNKHDPDSLLYAITAVGSDEWTQDADGRLCRGN